jgi:acylphosphatase
MRERRRIHYTGRVQGVGFRWTTARVLGDLDLSGYVRNLPDGRVELVLEGEPQAIEEGARRLRDTMKSYIRSESQETSPATGEFRGFGVRR